ncbi:MAG: N,N-dimethylformamidase beta subunit family domain-containing protein, partial [Alphaproteobacteria bacterium]
MKTIAGYTDKISVAPGERIKVMVSCEDGARQYRARVVRLISTDDHPDGPGLVERPIRTEVEGTYPGRKQRTCIGSSVVVPRAPALETLESFTAQAMIWPTMPGAGRQTILGTWSEERGAGFALELDETGALALRLGGGAE